MNEFLNVAKNLEIKEISKDVEIDEENVLTLETIISEMNEQFTEPEINTDTERNEISVKNRQISRNIEGMFDCDQCESKFTRKPYLYRLCLTKP